MTAIFAPTAAFAAALAIDTGAISSQKRALQGYVDMAAVAAAANIDNAEAVARQVLIDNGVFSINQNPDDAERDVSTGRLKVEVGRYTHDKAIAHENRFVEGAASPDAVRVSLTEAPRRYFDFLGTSASDIKVSGTARHSSQAAISVGSRLLSLDDGLINALLSGLTGSEIELSALSYDALLDARVDLLSGLDALATELELEAVTYHDLLTYDVSLAELAKAMKTTVDGRPAARSALDALATDNDLDLLLVSLGELIDLGPASDLKLGERAAGLDLKVDALQLLTVSAAAANGDHQVDLDLGATVPGLADVNLSVLIGERPQSTSWFSLSDERGEPVSTAQVRLFLEASIGGSLIGGDLVRLPLYLELASAEARVTDIVCKPGQRDADRVAVSVQPGLMTMRIADIHGDLREFGSTPYFEPAELLNATLIRVTGMAQTRLAAPDADTIWFSQRDIGGDPKTVETHDALGGALSSTVRDLELDVDILGISLLSPRLIQAQVADVLAVAAEPVDQIVFSLTSALGLGLGEADVWLHDADCNQSVLVQ